MGNHRQQMNDKDRLEWDIMQYNKRKEAQRGHNYKYLTDDLWNKLISDGYTETTFSNGEKTTFSESTAVGAVQEFKRKFYYARIICVANKLRIKQYSVWYKKGVLLQTLNLNSKKS